MSEDTVSMQFTGGGDLPQFIEEINARLKALEGETGAAKEKTSALDGAVGKLAKTLTAGAVAFKAYAFAAQSVNAAMGAIASNAKVEAVIKATGAASGVTAEQMKLLNEELRNNSVYSSGAIAEAQALMATFSTIGSETFPRAMQAAADMAAVTGSLESATMMLSKALDDPINGLDALSRSGFKFNDQQKALIKTMAESGQVMKAQAYILDEVAKSQGGVAKAIADTPAGQLTKLKNEFADIQAELGAKLIPALVAFQKTLNDVTRFLSEHGEVIVGVAVGAMVVMNAQIIAVTRSVIAMTAAMMANPLFLAGTAVALAVMGVAMAVKSLSQNSDAAVTSISSMGAEVRQVSYDLSGLHTKLSDFLKAKEIGRKSGVEQKVASIKEEYRKLREELESHPAVVTIGADGNAVETRRRLDDEIRELDKAMAADLAEIYNEDAKERISHYNKAMEEIALSRMTDFDREIALIKKQSEEYEKAVKARGLTAKAAAADLAKIAEWRTAQEDKVIEAYYADYGKRMQDSLNKDIEAQKKKADEAKKLRAESTALELKEYDVLKKETAVFYDEEKQKYAKDAVERVQLQKKASEELLRISADEYSARRNAIRTELAEELKQVGDNTAERVRLERAASLQIREIDAQEKAEKARARDADVEAERAAQEKKKALAMAWGDAAISAINSVASVIAAQNAAKIRGLDTEAAKEKETIEKSRMSKKAKAAEEARIDEETAKKKHEIATSQWHIDLAMAVVNSAAAVVKTMASIPYPFNIPPAAAQAIAGAAQVAVINANKPKMALGGFVPGRSLSGDQVDIRANSGEVVLTPEQQRNFMLMANGTSTGSGGNITMGDTNIVINGGADSSTVAAISQTLADHRQGILELLYDAERRGEIDHSRLAFA